MRKNKGGGCDPPLLYHRKHDQNEISAQILRYVAPL